jgi:hypoxanthine phosphoribosyltransferase
MTQTIVTMQFDPLISQEEISKKIALVARQVDRDYADKDLVIVMIMKGAICFVADLIRSLNVTYALDFLYCSSYHGTERQKEIRIYGLEDVNVAGRHVLIVDDIFDSGRTIYEVKQQLEKKGAADVRSMVLLERQITRALDYRPEYMLFPLDGDAFVVGYGLDYHEKYRGLPGIFSVRSDSTK